MTDDTQRVQAVIDTARTRGLNCAELPAGETFRIAGKVRLPLGFVLSGGSSEQERMTKLIFTADGGFECESMPETDEERPLIQWFYFDREDDAPPNLPEYSLQENLIQHNLSSNQWLSLRPAPNA